MTAAQQKTLRFSTVKKPSRRPVHGAVVLCSKELKADSAPILPNEKVSLRARLEHSRPIKEFMLFEAQRLCSQLSQVENSASSAEGHENAGDESESPLIIACCPSGPSRPWCGAVLSLLSGAAAKPEKGKGAASGGTFLFTPCSSDQALSRSPLMTPGLIRGAKRCLLLCGTSKVR